MLVLALCAAWVPGLAVASPWVGALPLGPLAAVEGPSPPETWPAPQALPAVTGKERPAQDERLEQMRGGS